MRLHSQWMEGSQRRLLRWLTLIAALAVLVQALTGATELALYATPVLLLFGLLASGRFIAENRIVRRWRGARPARRARPVRAGWAHGRERALVSQLERRVRSERGPPALAAIPA